MTDVVHVITTLGPTDEPAFVVQAQLWERGTEFHVPNPWHQHQRMPCDPVPRTNTPTRRSTT